MEKNTTRQQLKSYRSLLTGINTHRGALKNATCDQLKQKSLELAEKARSGETTDNLMPEAYALVCEAAGRELGLHPYDVQIAAAIAMHSGKLTQMQTGEGKTLAAVMPVYLNALTGKGVHILTFNDYLARRDALWMGPVYRYLGLTVDYVQEGMNRERRKKAYQADITYLTAKEAGFDFLRDQRCTGQSGTVQRGFSYAVVDEADSIMIDEARIPLVLAGEIAAKSIDHYKLADLVGRLDDTLHYKKDDYSRDVNFTAAGLDLVEKSLGCGNLHDLENNPFLSALNLALQAQQLLRRDVDYIVREGNVELVDEFTGRVADKRRWPYGLQAAVEAKEGLEIQPEGMVLGSITILDYLKLYPKLTGMTATAQTATGEFQTFYGLEVTDIPTNRDSRRIDHPDRVFTHKQAKTTALVREIKALHAKGRPILVGTAGVSESEQLAQNLQKAGVGCRVLNAKNDEEEARIIAEAGALGAVTISTNMAGRGTDIRLGGKNRETYRRVAELGGLVVIGTNRHESRRIDNQLRGRAGRQGDPGETRFFISLEDDLMERYHIHELIPARHRPARQEAPIDNPIINAEIDRAQRIIEGQNLEIRKTLRNYSFMVEQQRQIIHGKRRRILREKERYVDLAQLASERWNRLLPKVGLDVLKQVEKVITLYQIDRGWARHLDYVSQVREGIHLWSLAGKTPAFEFQKLIIEAFGEMEERIRRQIVETFNVAVITESGIDAEAEGLIGPSATWTYLVNDTPFSTQLQKALLGSAAFSIGASLLFLPYLPLLLIGKIVAYLKRRKRKLV